MKTTFLFILSLSTCSAVIYHLNDTEYQRMPPLFSLDEYESCLVEEGSAYCMLQLHLYAEPGNQLMRVITDYSEYKNKHYNHSVIERGICVKRSCGKYASSARTSSELTRALEACVSAGLQRAHGLRARTAALLYCDRQRTPRRADGWDTAVLILSLALVSINVVGSLYDYILSKQNEKRLGNENQFLLSFSVKRNWKRLTNTETSDPQIQDMQFFYGLRTIINLCTILLHAFMGFVVFTENTHDVEKAYENPLYLLFINGLTIVNIFFFLSGFLEVYRLQAYEQKSTFTVWDVPRIMLLRISRLVPSLAMTLALVTTWVRHAGSGPLWNMFVSGMVADCRTYWWRYLLFINNYSDESKFCLRPAWQLAADVQVFLVGVSAYILTRGRMRCVLLAALLLLSAAAPAVHFVLHDMDTVLGAPEQIRTMVADAFWFQHIPGHTNFPCFILGMASAVQLYAWQKKGGNRVNNRMYSVLQYVALAVLVTALYSGSAFYADGPRAPLVVRAAYISTMRVVVGLATAQLTMALFTHTPTYLKSFLSWRGWVVPSRLTYNVFLLHMVLATMLAGARVRLSHFSTYNVAIVGFYLVVASYVIAVPFHLIVEAPFTTLFRYLLTKQTPSPDNNGTSAINGTSKGSVTSVESNTKKML